MYVRARPYADVSLLKNIINNEVSTDLTSEETKLYFDSGTSAIQWFLEYQKQKLQKRLYVGVQVLTCSSVRSAIERSGNTPIYLDIDEKYFTTLEQQLEDSIDKIDILILTHLYGIANPEYEKIRVLCKEHNVILINDLALSVESRNEYSTIESYEDYYFYSYSFDKPIAAGYGGMLKVKQDDKSMINKYKELQILPSKIYDYKVKQFFFYYLLTDSTIYKREFRKNSIIEKLFINLLKISTLEAYKLVISNILASKFNAILAKIERLFTTIFLREKYAIYRLDITHIQYILKVEKEKEMIFQNYRLASQKMLDTLTKKYFIKIGNKVNTAYGQRYTLLVDDRKLLVNNLKKDGIESGPHNWDTLICNESDTINYPIAQKVKDSLINIPIWSERIWKK